MVYKKYYRNIEQNINQKINKGKAIIVIGARQVGKTTLIKKILNERSHLLLDGDDPEVRNKLEYPNTEEIKRIIGNNKYVFIDEAQRIKGIGLTIKIIIDQLDKVQLFISGSSSFELGNKLNEPLTGRKWEYKLYPISWEEFENHHGYLVSEQQLKDRLIYGFYPDVLNNQGDEVEILKNLTDSYLYKDIFAFSGIKKPDALNKLVEALAYQIGREVNYRELAQIVNVEKNTIIKYIDILEKAFVVFRLGSFSRNLRNEIKTNKKIYFYDNGVRNMVIRDFKHFDLRADKGALWENFLVSERVKQNEYKQSLSKIHFWRTKQQQEVDFVEDNDGKIYGYEFKWNRRNKIRLSKTFVQSYNAVENVIDRQNFRDFVNIIIKK